MARRRPPTMTDVARRANVSQATVSYVLNNVTKHTIPEETKKAVWDAARELDYRPNLAARDLVTGLSSVVVCVVPPIPLSEPVVTLLGELTGAFAVEGIVMAVHFERMGDDSLDAMRKALNPRRIFSLFPGSAGAEADLANTDEYSTDPGSWLQVDHLVGAGHRRLAFAASAQPELRWQSDARLRSTQRRARERGLAPVVSESIRTDTRGVAEIVAGWHSEGVTGICANNDEVALAIIRGAHQAGLRVPADVSVIGYDGTIGGAASDPPLTSVGWRVRSLELFTRPVLTGAAISPEDVADPLEVWLVERESVSSP